MMVKALAQAALVGVRNTPLTQLATDDASVDALLASARTERTEQTLLRWAAIAVSMEEAGRKAARPDIVDAPAYPSDPRPKIRPGAAQLLQRVLEGFQPALLDSLLKEIAAHGRRVPPALLPPVLDHGKQHAHRDAAAAVACNAARWLAGQNPEWAYALGTDDSEGIFETGPSSTRREALHRLRAKDPARARELLDAVWATEAPENRSMFLEALATGLSTEDEPFLEFALDDRRKEVRAAAVRLLAKIPASRLVARARAIAAATLRVEKGWLKTKLEVNPPTECTKPMQRDGIEVKSPRGDFGERAWWLAQVIARVPPSDWTRQFDLAPGDLLELTRKHDYGLALRAGLAEATKNFCDAEFARAWFARAGDSDFAPHWRSVLAVLKDLPDFEGLVLDALRAQPREIPHDLLDLLPVPWSEAVSRALLPLLRNQALSAKGPDDASDYSTAPVFTLATLRMTPLAEALTGWDIPNDASPRFKKIVDDFIAILELRRQFSRYLEV